MDYTEILDHIAAEYKAALQENYIGLYVHGSIAMRCFHPMSSDIDYVCIVEREPDDEAKRRVLDATLALVPFAPKKGLEKHILRREECLQPRHPVYFCLHYSPMHQDACLRDPDAYIRTMKGNDPDLAAHLTVLKERGLRWDGPSIDEVFGPVPREAYLDSILRDVSDASGDPVYRILNLCRVLGYLNGAGVLSKKEGGEWFLRRQEEPLTREALACYEEGRSMQETPQSVRLCKRLLDDAQKLAKGEAKPL